MSLLEHEPEPLTVNRLANWRFPFSRKRMIRVLAIRTVHRRWTLLRTTSDSGETTLTKHPGMLLYHVQYPTNVPQEPPVKTSDNAPETGTYKTITSTVNRETVQLLQRLSLVDLDTEDALRTLHDSITFASRILHINTDGVKPLVSVLEKEQLNLRADIVDDGNQQEHVLRNASITEEEYFMAPPGNIPLEWQPNRSEP
ncbi:glutamyl-tRNA(Gln) amidotransferase subunit C, mitochondrial [Anopheles cruzii]|uniref:glutamyl-tRNA(Gln) amidotransferase subunit C, mitochondrial n=1 Tax=Anopheles cruzii TaxID=68878 RepID=UPI0022EC62DB|nr:glutamyl-tRNA(Gln) amidotransferase subunit C, mitochondrial [Anopheles cruzii]XP_052861651.1 glutamyl-tRNA(Gln) amidotransferase subunit C, mitochondrial [Anopheles cruzii]